MNNCVHNSLNNCEGSTLYSVGGKQYCILHFPHPDKDLNSFKKQFQKLLARFDQKSGYYFNNIHFPNGFEFPKGAYHIVDFSYTSFPDGIDFSECSFGSKSGPLHFLGTDFRGSAKFYQTVFKGETWFQNAKFKGNVDFSNAVFEHHVFFTRGTGQTIFLDGADFAGTKFSGVIDFSGASFSGLFRFYGYKLDGLRIFSNSAGPNFQSIVFRGETQIRFLFADLTKCLLLNTDIKPFVFIDVTWPRRVRNQFTRYAVADEFDPDYETNLHQLIILYRSLRLSYEDKGDNVTAGEFHFAEQEMQRQSNKPLFRYFSIQAFYRYLSAYGVRHRRAGYWLMGSLTLFTIAFMLLGIKYETDHGTNLIQYHCCSINFFNTGKTLSDFLETFLFLIKVVSFGRGISPYEFSSLEGRLMGTAASIFIPIVIGLFVFAVRNRYKR